MIPNENNKGRNQHDVFFSIKITDCSPTIQPSILSIRKKLSRTISNQTTGRIMRANIINNKPPSWDICTDSFLATDHPLTGQKTPFKALAKNGLFIATRSLPLALASLSSLLPTTEKQAAVTVSSLHRAASKFPLI
jgi:hypothetical protein